MQGIKGVHVIWSKYAVKPTTSKSRPRINGTEVESKMRMSHYEELLHHNDSSSFGYSGGNFRTHIPVIPQVTKDIQCDLNEQSSTGFISQIYVQPSENLKHKVF